MMDAGVAPRLPLRAGLRFYQRHPVQLILTVAGIALGVAAVVAIDLASFSARQAFDATTQLFRGQASHEIVGPAGGVATEVFVDLRRRQGIAESVPVVEARVRLAVDPQRPVTLLGADPLSALRLNWRFLGAGAGNDLLQLISEPGAVLLPESLAGEWGVAPGDKLELLDPYPGRSVTVIGLMPDSGDERFLFADLATAQELLGRDSLTRIDLAIDDRRAAALRPMLADRGLRLRSLAERVGQLDTMTRSFRINLQALSLLTLVVGAFLVYSTVAFAVVRRRESFGLLRSLGMGRRQVFAVVLAEILVLAAFGIGLGLLAGILLGSGLVRLVLRTVGDLYLSSAVSWYGVSAVLLLKAAALGAAASLVAALVPAAEAAAVQPRQAMIASTGIRRLARRRPWQALAALLAAAAGSSLVIRQGSLTMAFAGVFLLLIAGALAVPLIIHPISTAFGNGCARAGWLPGAYAGRSVALNLSRTGAASAALMLAVATFVGVGVMIGSFRHSVTAWLDYSLDADVMVRVPPALSPATRAAVIEELAALPGAEGLRMSRRVALPDGEGLASLLAVQSDAGVGRWPKTDADGDRLLRQLAAGNRVIVSEAYARKRDVGTGDELELLTPEGPRRFGIAGIFVDYSTDLGLVAMDLGVYRRHFLDDGLDTIGLFAADGRESELLDAARRYADERDLQVTTSANLRELSLEVFDRTFTITQVLRLIAGLVAVVAIVNALQAQRLDSARETAVLRAIGLAPNDVMRLNLLQTGLLGGCAGLAALPFGLLLAALLIFVVNRIAFGWSIDFLPDAATLAQGLGLAVVAGLAAGWWPARQAVRGMPASGLREF